MNISPEIIASIITFVSTAILSFAVYYYRSHKGNWVILQKMNETSVIHVSSDKLNQKLLITYNDKEVDQIISYEFILFNNGEMDISNLKLSLVLLKSENSEFVEYRTLDSQGITKISVNPQKDDVGRQELFIERPYLNSRKKYNEEIIHIQFLTDYRLMFYLKGGNEGWNAKYVDKNDVFVWRNVAPFCLMVIGVILVIISPKFEYSGAILFLGLAGVIWSNVILNKINS